MGAFLKMLTGTTKQKEDKSFDNINTLLITSTILMVLSCVMEVVMYFLYNNKVHPRKEIVAEPEEESKKQSDQEPTASSMDDSENNSHNVNAINLVENVAEACPDERPIEM